MQHDVAAVLQVQQFFRGTQRPSVSLSGVQPVMVDGSRHQNGSQAMLTTTVCGQDISLYRASGQQMERRRRDPRTVTVSHQGHGNAGRKIIDQPGQIQTVEAGHATEYGSIDLRKQDRPFFTGPAVKDDRRRIVR